MNKMIIMLLLITTMLLASCTTNKLPNGVVINGNEIILPDKQGKELDSSATVTSASIIAQQTYNTYHYVAFFMNLENKQYSGQSYKIKIILTGKDGTEISQTFNSDVPHNIGDKYTSSGSYNIVNPYFSDPNFCGGTQANLQKMIHYVCDAGYTNCKQESIWTGVNQVQEIKWNCVSRCGDGSIDLGETCKTCPADVICVLGQKCDSVTEKCTSTCGDGICNYNDRCNNCPGDCPCSSSQVCSGSSCITACIVGEKKCYDTTNYQICNAQRIWDTKIACAATQTCSGGQCVSSGTACTPAAKECNGAVATQYRECDISGQWTGYKECETGQTCIGQGICTGETCTTINEKKCDGLTNVMTCDANHNWVLYGGCPGTTSCANGVCIEGGNNNSTCKAYEELKDSGCKFSIIKAFTNSGFSQLKEDKPEIVYGTGIIIVLAIIALIMYFKYKKSSDVFY